jgi:hypothetical protein
MNYSYLFIVLACTISPVWAIKLVSESTVPVSSKVQPAFGGVVMKETHSANDHDTLREGKIQEIDFKKHTLRIRDVIFNFNPNRIRVFSNAHATSVGLLAQGRVIRFLLDPEDSHHQTIGVVYMKN